jgi:hypothetical protein
MVRVRCGGFDDGIKLWVEQGIEPGMSRYNR